MSFTVLGFLVSEFRITLPKLIIRDIPVDFVLVSVFIVRFIGKAGISGNDYTGLEDIFV